MGLYSEQTTQNIYIYIYEPMELSEVPVIVLWIKLHNKSKMPGRLWRATLLLNVEEKIKLSS